MLQSKSEKLNLDWCAHKLFFAWKLRTAYANISRTQGECTIPPLSTDEFSYFRSGKHLCTCTNMAVSHRYSNFPNELRVGFTCDHVSKSSLESNHNWNRFLPNRILNMVPIRILFLSWVCSEYIQLPSVFYISLQSIVFRVIDVDCLPNTDCTKLIYMSNKTLTTIRCSVPHKPIHVYWSDRAVAPFDIEWTPVHKIYRLSIPWYDTVANCVLRRHQKRQFYDKSDRSANKRRRPMEETKALVDSVCQHMSLVSMYI